MKTPKTPEEIAARMAQNMRRTIELGANTVVPSTIGKAVLWVIARNENISCARLIEVLSDEAVSLPDCPRELRDAAIDVLKRTAKIPT